MAFGGGCEVNSLIAEMASSENGVVVFGSSTGREFSLERPEWGNRAFTKALIEGIAQGKADLLHRGRITLSELDAYLADRVMDLTNGAQHPVMSKPTTITNFSLAVVK